MCGQWSVVSGGGSFGKAFLSLTLGHVALANGGAGWTNGQFLADAVLLSVATKRNGIIPDGGCQMASIEYTLYNTLSLLLVKKQQPDQHGSFLFLCSLSIVGSPRHHKLSFYAVLYVVCSMYTPSQHAAVNELTSNYRFSRGTDESLRLGRRRKCPSPSYPSGVVTGNW